MRTETNPRRKSRGDRSGRSPFVLLLSILTVAGVITFIGGVMLLREEMLDTTYSIFDKGRITYTVEDKAYGRIIDSCYEYNPDLTGGREVDQEGVALAEYIDASLQKEIFTASGQANLARRQEEQWGSTPEYKEFEEKSRKRSKADEDSMMAAFMKVFEEFGSMRGTDPASAEAQAQVRKLQDFITKHFYKCSDEILCILGEMYAAGGEFTENIDKMGGEGTAGFTCRAIRIYCGEGVK